MNRPDSNLWHIGGRVLDLSRRPCVMGILNVTPDSFSDGAKYNDPQCAVDHALEMEAEGADIIDIGGESTRPYADPVPAEEELRRVLPVLQQLSGKLRIPISIDTYKSAVAREALLNGAEIVNDISGFSFDDRMLEVVASTDAGVIITHTRGKPADMQKDTRYPSLIEEVIGFLRQAMVSAETRGITRDRIVIDPGIGFGKDVNGNLAILRRLREFQVLGRPILVGTSRKLFIGTVLDRAVEDRIFGTAATVALALANGASIIRVHEVRAMRDVADMAAAITGGMPV